MRPDCIFSSHLSSEVTLAATCIFGDQRDFGSRQLKGRAEEEMYRLFADPSASSRNIESC